MWINISGGNVLYICILVLQENVASSKKVLIVLQENVASSNKCTSCNFSRLFFHSLNVGVFPVFFISTNESRFFDYYFFKTNIFFWYFLHILQKNFVHSPQQRNFNLKLTTNVSTFFAQRKSQDFKHWISRSKTIYDGNHAVFFLKDMLHLLLYGHDCLRFKDRCFYITELTSKNFESKCVLTTPIVRTNFITKKSLQSVSSWTVIQTETPLKKSLILKQK